MLKKIISSVVAFAIMFSLMGGPILAEAADFHYKSDVKCVGVEPVEYTDLDESNRNQIDEVLEQNGIAQKDVLGIFRYDISGSEERITIPGWIVLTGQWLSQYSWKLVVLNAGIGTVNSYMTKVQLINKSYGPVTRESITLFPGLLPGKSDSSTYTGAVQPVDVANYYISGTVNHGEPFEMSGADVRK